MDTAPPAPGRIEAFRSWVWRVFVGALAAQIAHDLLVGAYAGIREGLAGR